MKASEEFRIRSVEEQMRWEVRNVQRGIEMYRASERRAEEKQGAGFIADTKPGMKMMAAIMPTLVAAIEARQREGVGFLKGRGVTPTWVLPLLSISPEKAAFITLRTVLGHPEKKVTPLALSIANRCQTEREFEMFAEAERMRVSEGKLTKGEETLGLEKPRNIVALMKEYAGEVNERTFKKWRQKADAWERLGWSQEDREHLGALLVYELVMNAGNWFEIRMVHAEDRQATQRTLHMTPEAQAFLGHARELAEVNRPWLTPMIAPPKAWEPVENETT